MTNPLTSLGLYIRRLDSAAMEMVEALDMAYDVKFSGNKQDAYAKYLDAVSKYKELREELYGSYFPLSSSK